MLWNASRRIDDLCDCSNPATATTEVEFFFRKLVLVHTVESIVHYLERGSKFITKFDAIYFDDAVE